MDDKVEKERLEAHSRLYAKNEKGCHNCHYWKQKDELSNYATGLQGECENEFAQYYMERWPITMQNEKCFEWKQAESSAIIPTSKGNK